MQSSRPRDLAPVVDRKESVATLASAIEARFPKDSAEARLTASFLHSPEPASIHLLVEKFMKDGDDKGDGSGDESGKGLLRPGGYPGIPAGR